MCNFIMIMILLVTAYTGMWWKPDGHRIGEGYTQSYTQSYSKYLRQPRVRTARPASLPILPAVVRLVDAPSGSSTRRSHPEGVSQPS